MFNIIRINNGKLINFIPAADLCTTLILLKDDDPALYIYMYHIDIYVGSRYTYILIFIHYKSHNILGIYTYFVYTTIYDLPHSGRG